MSDLIIFSKHSLSSIDEWQSALNAEGYDLRLSTPIPFEALHGHVPAYWQNSDIGFTCVHLRKNDISSRITVLSKAKSFEKILGLSWNNNPNSKLAALMAALSYARATNGTVFLAESNSSASLEEISRALKDVGLIPQAIQQNQKKRIAPFEKRPDTKISGSSANAIAQLRSAEYAVLVGKNNCGKSFVLKSLTEHWGKNSSYLGPARYQNFNLLGFYTPNQNKKDDKWQQFINQLNRTSQNFDNSPVNLQQAIAELNDEQRATLSEIVNILLGVELEIRQTVENNRMSQMYVSCGGHNISYTSSGLRLIATLVTCLLDADYETVLIDEPELGISPEAQGLLADFLFDRKLRERFFPHIKTLIFATHSTIFLDRVKIGNNYVVEKSGDEISIRHITNQREFNQIHFFLLGNRFETLYLPSLILLVEGKSDHKFIERVLSLRFPNSRFSVIATNSDGRVKDTLHIAKGLLSDIQRSPYHDRILVILDSQHSRGLPDEIAAMGVLKENILVWPKNGIEYFYPESILDKIFGQGTEIVIDGDIISRNGLSFTKEQLVDRVVFELRPDTKMNVQFQELLLDKLQKML